MPERTWSRDRLTTVLFAGAGILAVYAAVVAATGGFELRVGGVRVRSHSWIRPGAAAAFFAVLLIVTARARLAAAALAASRALAAPATPRALVAAAMIWTLAAGVLFGTFAAGGSDSYGYVTQARLFAAGRLTDNVPFDPAYQWPHADKTLTPLGFIPTDRPGEISPTYPPGYPLLMALPALISDTAVYLVLPLLGVWAVFLCYRIGFACGNPLAGGIAAWLLAVSPTFVFHVVQPMSDVPATAFWLAALLLASRGTRAASAWSGAAASMAIMIRPNLAPLAIVPLTLAVAQPSGGSNRMRSGASFIAAMLPLGIALGWIQAARYGSPFTSGYGHISQLLGWENVRPNLERYPRWLTETHTWFIWVSALAPFIALRRQSPARPIGWASLAFSAGVLALYLPYAYFQAHEWMYTRFLLPAIPLLLLLATLVALSVFHRLPAIGRAPALVALVGGLTAFCLYTAHGRHAFELRRGEQRYILAGDHVTGLPASAIILAVQHSGSVRLYGQRPILRWDLIEPEALDSVLATLRASGRVPFMVADDFEVEAFRARFAPAHQAAVGQARLIRLIENVRIYAFD